MKARSPKDVHKSRPGWNVFRDGSPNGETPDRADRLIARLRLLDGNVALFSHGQFSCAFGVRWVELSVVEARHFILGTASLSILDFDRSHPEARVIELWNAVPAVLWGGA